MNAVDIALIMELRQADAHLGWNELATLTGRTREHLGGRVAGLREAGFVIEERPGFGLRLLESPDRLLADDLLARLAPDSFWREIIVFHETDSTNERAAQLGRGGAREGVVIFAERQTAVRGRFGREWASAAAKGLWFSLLLRPGLPMSQWPRLTTWAAVSVARTIESSLGVPVSIKWPNDLMIHGRKLAGILTELGAVASGAPFAVVGIGINVNHASEDFPAELRERATSLRLAVEKEVYRPELAAAILAGLSNTRMDPVSRFDQVIAEAAGRSCVLGKAISALVEGERVDGIAEGLDAEGRLLLKAGSGILHTLGAGEVTLRTNC